MLFPAYICRSFGSIWCCLCCWSSVYSFWNPESRWYLDFPDINPCVAHTVILWGFGRSINDISCLYSVTNWNCLISTIQESYEVSSIGIGGGSSWWARHQTRYTSSAAAPTDHRPRFTTSRPHSIPVCLTYSLIMSVSQGQLTPPVSTSYFKVPRRWAG